MSPAQQTYSSFVALLLLTACPTSAIAEVGGKAVIVDPVSEVAPVESDAADNSATKVEKEMKSGSSPDPVVVGENGSKFRVIEMSIDQLVRMIADHHGLVPHISDRVRGRVVNLRLQGDAETMMKRVAKVTNLDWFVYDGALEVYTKDEIATRFVPLGGLPFERAEQVLKDSGFETADIVPVAGGSAVKVSGPPKAAEIVEALFTLTAAEPAPVVPEKMIVVRRGITKSVETFGEASAAQLNEERKAGLIPAPEATATKDVEETAAQGEDALVEAVEQPKE
jgi:hypothetical protein